jgi:hypothetical protein
MTLGAVVCMLTVVISVVRDLFFPETRNVEVWFGFEITGPLALATAPVHWAIFAVGAWAFWTARPWVARFAAAYVFYAAFAHLVWSEASPNGRGWPIGLVQAVALSVVAFSLLRADQRRIIGG